MPNSIASKLVIALAIILFVVLLVMPRIVGGSIQSATVDSLINMVPIQSRGLVTVTQANFSSGWFSSDATVSVSSPGLPGDNGEPVVINLEMEIQHGPLLFTTRGPSLGLAYADINPIFSGLNIDELSEFTEQLDISEFDSDLYLLAGFDNSLRLGFGMGEVTITETTNAGNRLAIDGIESQVTLFSDRSLEGIFTLGETNLNSAAESLAVQIDSVDYNFRQGDIDELVSDAQGRLTIPFLSSTGPMPFEITGTVLDSAVKLSGPGAATLDYSNLLAIASMQWTLPVTAVTWHLDINQLNRQILEDYYLIMQRLQPAGAGSTTPDVNEIAQIVEQMFIGLIQQSLQLSSVFELDAYDGDLLVDLQLDWRGLPFVSSLAEIDPGAAINAVDFQLTIDADEAAVNQSPVRDLVNAYLGQGAQGNQNGRIRLEANLSDGQLEINGQSFPLSQFLGR